MPPALEPAARVEQAVRVLRGHRVLLDDALAALYGVEVRTLNQAVKRNIERFPPDFMCRLTSEEALILRSQIVISSGPHGGRRHLPLAFTEQGVAMLSSVLRSRRAVLVNVEIMRAFVRLRGMTQDNADLARKLATLERKYDGQFKAVFDALRELMTPPGSARKRIGFRSD